MTIAIALGLYALYYFKTLDERTIVSSLSETDRIEVDSVDVHFETIKNVVTTRTLTGGQAQELSRLWNNQGYIYGLTVMCHYPAYRLCFYRKDSLLAEATICFHCHNIYFDQYPGHDKTRRTTEVGFGSLFDLIYNRSPSPRLHAFLDNLFPNPKDKSVYHEL